MEAIKRVTITRDHIDLVDKLVTNPRDDLQRLEVTQLTGISDQSVKRICFGLSLAKRGIEVRPCNNIPGKDMCRMINEKYAYTIARNACNNIHKNDIERNNLLYAFKDGKNVKGVGKVNDFDKTIDECKPKVEVKSDIQYLADAVMKLAEATETRNKIIELLINKN